MKNGVFTLIFLSGLATLLHADSQHILRASFPDGTGLEIFTEATGSAQIDSEGEMGIGPGAGSQCVDPSRGDCPDAVNRVVVDRANNILFVYNVEADRGTRPDTVRIRIEPISAATEAGMLKYFAAPGHPRFSGVHLPTVARVREFPAVKIGEAVTLDILSNPSTGEKIFDVLRPVRIATPAPTMSVSPAPDRESVISLNHIALRVNGRAMPAPSSFTVGSAVRIDVPRHGTYVLSTYNPREASPDHRFSAIAHADGKTLSWVMDRDRVEITSRTNVLVPAENGTLWIYHDPHYQADVVGLQAADTVGWLLPKR